MKHVMIDEEPFGLRNSSAIITIGAVEFDPYTKGSFGREFHEAIDLKSALNHGATVDASTILWWLEQSDVARAALVSKLRAAASLSTVLGAFTSYLRSVGPMHDLKIWSCGYKDLTWLESAYESIKQPVPWGYRVGDYRTIRDEFALPEDSPPPTTSHDALCDAKWQAELLQNVFARLQRYRKIATEMPEGTYGNGH